MHASVPHDAAPDRAGYYHNVIDSHFRMRTTLLTALIALLATLSGCSGGTLSTRTARQQIATLGDATLIPSDIEVARIDTQTESRAIAETTVKMTFAFDKNAAGEWHIVSARLGDRQWIDIETLLIALERQQRQETDEGFRLLVAGLEKYRLERGNLPELSEGAHISDVLHPIFMSDLVREDAWGGPIVYEPSGDGGFRLSSAGPDGRSGTGDDVVVSRQGG